MTKAVEAHQIMSDWINEDGNSDRVLNVIHHYILASAYEGIDRCDIYLQDYMFKDGAQVVDIVQQVRNNGYIVKKVTLPCEIHLAVSW